MRKKLNFLRLLSCNGWVWDIEGEEDHAGCRFNLTVLGNSYHYVISAIVSEYPRHLDLSGYYGVQWLEMVKMVDTDAVGITLTDLDDIHTAIINAENNLVTLGVPFVLDYKFHNTGENGLTAEEKKRINIECRKLYGLTVDEGEDDDGQDD